MVTLLYEPFSEERRMVRRCWNEQYDFISNWLDYLYLMTGRAETGDYKLINL
ncbi:hypothetical protein [Dysgonomonas sp. 520]|uniref:hypothetical protein n=1 Tax=Dysgonomonas sp. 520 TaxID=2302931 RepID=UPI0013D6E433|nr:hypothetical protein [Dysgonomonas sp. 520]